MKQMRVAVVGAGAISDIYLKNMIYKFPILQVDSICANHLEHARAKAEKYGIRASTFEEILKDDSIEMIVNLTPAFAHYEIIKKSLLAGKHVYTEKIMTDDVDRALELMHLADERKLYLGSAPDTFLGSALQTARKAVDDGLIGEVTSCAAAANRDNNYLLSVSSFLRMKGGGVCFDYAVYYMTALVSLLGPVKRVAAITRAPYQKHINIIPENPLYGKEMDTPNESQVAAVLQFESGIMGTLHINADSVLKDQAFMAIYGTKGILYLPDPNQFGGKVRLLKNSLNLREPSLIEELPNLYGYTDNSRGIGPADMAYAIRNKRVNRANKEFAYHVLEVLNAIMKSSESETFQEIYSSCIRPVPMQPAADGAEDESYFQV